MSRFSYKAFLLAVSFALAGEAAAIGLGELRGRAVLGESPRFEIDLVGAPKALLDPGCFKLIRPVEYESLPWLKHATFKIRKGNPPVLEISSTDDLADPALVVNVYVGCAQDIVREYVVFVSPPDRQSLRGPNAPLPVIADSGAAGSPGRPLAEAQPKSAREPAPVKVAPAAPAVPAGIQPKSADDAAAQEKLRQMEATIGELQQRATVLAEKLEQTSGETAAPAAPAAEQSPAAKAEPAAAPAPSPAASAPVQANTAVNSEDSGLTYWLAALIGALFVAAVLLWRKYAARRAEAAFENDFVDPRRKGEEDDTASISRADPSAMAMPPKLEAPVLAMPAPLSVVDAQSQASAFSVSAATVDEQFEANPVLELAEIMLSFGRVKGAAQALQEYVDANPKDSVKPWLRLLDVYRIAGMRPEFDQVGKELNKHFNVAVQSWDDYQTDASIGENARKVDMLLDSGSAADGTPMVRGLEDMPGTLQQVVNNWHSPQALTYLERLLRDNRGGTRLGFPLPVVDDIVFLIELKEIANKMESETEK